MKDEKTTTTRRNVLKAAGAVMIGSTAGCIGVGEMQGTNEENENSFSEINNHDLNPVGRLTYSGEPKEETSSSSDVSVYAGDAEPTPEYVESISAQVARVQDGNIVERELRENIGENKAAVEFKQLLEPKADRSHQYLTEQDQIMVGTQYDTEHGTVTAVGYTQVDSELEEQQITEWEYLEGTTLEDGALEEGLDELYRP